jgi:alanyl-tRNA synthetase
MNPKEVRQKFLKYFEERNHKIVPSSSLVPTDSSVLLTTAGMQQFKDYFTGKLNPESDFGGLNTTSVQKCFRTSDVEEVGDKSHLTFFEMLGNFSFGGYFKEKAILYAYEFITKEMGLEVDYVTVFDPEKVSGEDWRKTVPFDGDSYNIWKDKIGLDESKIKREGADNFWGPTGSEGPCGPTTEIYVDGIEIWNIVFNEFYCDKDKKLTNLEKPGIDTGLGFERLIIFTEGADNIFETELFQNSFGDLLDKENIESARIVADHIRSSVFLLADGILPSNKEAGYVLRRLIRRLVIHSKKIDVSNNNIKKFIENIINYYGDIYKELIDNKDVILSEFFTEIENFKETLDEGMKEFNKLYPKDKLVKKISDDDAFNLYQSYGFPLELIKELAEERGYDFNEAGFNKRFEEHKEISRKGAEKKFGGHGLELDTGELKAGNDEEKEKVIKLHTATHLLHQALHDVLGDTRQEGSDINSKRARFDFRSDRKLTEEEIKKVENIINGKINENLPVNKIEMDKSEAEKTGALHFFKNKYPDKVNVYYVGPSLEEAYSKEFCAGPHVKNTGEIGEFKITKQKSVGRNIKRIKGIIINN